MRSFVPMSPEMTAQFEREAPAYAPKDRKDRPAARYAISEDGHYCGENLTDNKNLVVSCVGDLLCEEKLYKTHKRNDGFYFHDTLQFVQPIFAKSDLVIANLETTVCQSAPFTGEQYKIGGKFHCNGPVEFLEAVKQSGIDFLVMANNHNCDTGVNGLMETVHHVDRMGFMRTGVFRPEETKRWTLVESKGIKIAVLSYSTWFNGNESRFTELGQEKILNIYAPEKAVRDIQGAREDGAEFVLVYIHWGIDAEYKSCESESMRRMAKELADAGADYIVGSHPHSLQPRKIIVSAQGKRVPCIYSMGNFMTSEIMKISRETGILNITLEKTKDRIKIIKEEIVPCYIPNSAYDVWYPILPKGHMELTEEVSKKISNGYEHIGRIMDISQGHFLTKRKIHEILDIPMSGEDERYTKVEFALNAVPGCVAVVVQNDVGEPQENYTPAELADIAMSKGAKLLISNAQIEDYPCLVVSGSLFSAFSSIVAAIRNRFNPATLCVTGSIGKTSTTGMLKKVLGSKFKTFGSIHNANSIVYSAKQIQQLTSDVDVYLQEAAEGPPFGTASAISRMVQPQAAVITKIGTSHLESFGYQERILESCLGIQDGMPENGLLILNADDPFQWNAKPSRNALYYGVNNPEADYRAENIRGEDDHLLFDVLHDGVATPVKLYCFGMHNVLNALASFAAGKWAGMSDKEIAGALASYRTSGIRQNLVKYGGYRLFLDCFNAALESMESALDALGTMEIKDGGRRIAVLADIKEAGVQSDDVHRKVGQLVAGSKVDMLICYGENAKIIADTTRTLSQIPVFHTESEEELENLLRENIKLQDVTLFKGSRVMALERFVDRVFGTWFYESDEDAISASYTTSDESFSYRVYPDHVTVTNKLTAEERVSIPDFVDDRPVTGIDHKVFSRSKSYTRSVRFPAHLKNIRYCTFYVVSRLESVELPGSVRILQDSAFSTCKQLKSVTIADGCTHIGYRAFGNCTNLKSITIPASVNQIKEEAFLNCNDLTIYGAAGSFAEQYAKKHNIQFVDNTSAEYLMKKKAVEALKKHTSPKLRKKIRRLLKH